MEGITSFSSSMIKEKLTAYFEDVNYKSEVTMLHVLDFKVHQARLIITLVFSETIFWKLKF